MTGYKENLKAKMFLVILATYPENLAENTNFIILICINIQEFDPNMTLDTFLCRSIRLFSQDISFSLYSNMNPNIHSKQ